MTTPADLLEIAQSIQSAIPDETGQRTCINRAYYAIYHTANEIDARLHLPYLSGGNPGSGHEKLYNRLIACDSSNSPNWVAVKAIGYSAAKVLKPYRVLADYKLSEPVSPHDAVEVIAKAALLIKKAASL